MNLKKKSNLFLVSAWAQLGWYDIRSKYRRTFLGPLWISLSTGLTVGCLGFVYGSLFDVQWKTYLPYVTAGIISWTLISTMIIEGSVSLISYKHVFHSFRVPHILPVIRILVKSILVFFHNILVFMLVILLCDVKINLSFLLLIPSLFVIIFNGLWVGLLLSLICARFRDVQPLINAVVSVLFLVTPILWYPNLLSGGRKYIASLNPFTHYIAIIREPLMGNTPELTSWYVVIFITLSGCILTHSLYVRIRNKIIYWL